MATKDNKSVDLSALQAEIAKMMEEARAEAAKIVADAKAAAAVKPGSMTPEEMAAHKAYMDEEVEIKLFKDNAKYKDDVFVGCNGETIAIKRGERVKIKRKFAEILDHSEHQDYETAVMIEKKAAEWERKSANM